MSNRSKLPERIIYWMAIFYGFYAFASLTTISIIVEPLKTEFAIGANLIGVIAAFYFFAYAPMQLVVGYLVDRFTARPLITIGLFLAGLGSLLFGTAPTIGLAIAGRILIGIGASAAFISMAYVAAHYFAPNKLAFLTCVANGLALLGPIFTTTVLDNLVRRIGWRWTTIAFGLLGLLTAVVGAALFYFFRVEEPERISQNPFTHFRQVCRKGGTWINALIASLFYLIISTFGELWGLPYLTNVFGYRINTAGLMISSLFVGAIVGAPFIGYFSDRMSRRRPLLAFLAATATLLIAAILYLPGIALHIALLLFLGIASSGELLCYPIAIEMHDRSAKGMVLGVTNFFITGVSAFFQWGVGATLEKTGSYPLSVLLFPAALLIAFLATLALKERARP